MFKINKTKKDGIKKPFLTEGPVLHYSHSNVHRFWWVTVGVYLCASLFWSKIITGNLDALHIDNVRSLDVWSLGYLVVNPVSIFEYPYQIAVLGLLMAILSFTPIVVSQLLSSRYSVLLILMTAFIAKLPVLALFLMFCSFAVASRPLRFRSRFISIVLCSSPLLIYWGIFGGMGDIDPVKWGLSYTPWLLAWLAGLAICAIVLAIGHYNRYKPGSSAVVFLLALLITGFIFFNKISFAESDYQIYVLRNNPRECPAFHSRSISSILDKASDEPLKESEIFLTFPEAALHSEEQNGAARKKLLEELKAMMQINVWPLWFMEHSEPEFYDFESKRNERIEQLNYFINRHPKSRRMPIALYYKALMREYQPNVRVLLEDEVLEFYSGYPRQEVFPDWVRLYRDYPQSHESLEARWRIAVSLARRGDFGTAVSLCREALVKIEEIKTEYAKASRNSSSLFSRPADTVISERRLDDIKFRVKYLKNFIESNDIVDDAQYRERLAAMIGLDKNSVNYEYYLSRLAAAGTDTDPLRDNLELAKIQLIDSPLKKARALVNFIESNPGKQTIAEALYALGLCYVQLWRETDSDAEERGDYLKNARDALTIILEDYPQSPFTALAENIINGLPRPE